MRTLIIILALTLTDTAFANVIICLPGAPANVKLAAKEIRRYVYLRTGQLLPFAKSGKGITLKLDPSLAAQQYRLETADGMLAISGGSDVGLLYGAYRYAELLGVRFYLHGDVMPDEPLGELPVVNEIGTPLFALRGVNPWGSHPFGFDAWSADDYKAIFTQLAKMRMNFLGIHCYYEFKDSSESTDSWVEPTVWQGLPGEFDARGRVGTSYRARYFNTLLDAGNGQWRPRKTSEFHFGGALLFERDDWAPPVMQCLCPYPVTLKDRNELFNRAAAQFKDAFGFARQFGVKTCVGTETPLRLANSVAQRTTNVGAVYEGVFRRIMASHPLDYYWLWTPEDWTWHGNTPTEYSNTVADITLAIEALKRVNAPFRLTTAGWVLGPKNDRAAFDRDLPKDVPMSAINRDTGATPVDPAVGQILGREKWAIPWLESDNRQGLGAVQLEVGRVRRDAVDARQYGCTGLMGLHWRTEVISPNISALAQAGWDQSWNHGADKKPRSLPCDDFYADWAQVNFGLPAVGRVFAALDGRLPQVTDGGCPSGSLTPVKSPWSDSAQQFAFVDELEGLRPRIRGPGNLARFDYWLSSFKYIRSLAQLRCALAQPAASELTRLYGEAYGHLLATVNTPGALAMVVNLENRVGWGPTVAQHVQEPWPREYQGEPRLTMPTVRSVVNRSESLVLKIIALDRQPVKSVSVHLRPLGAGKWRQIPARHLARAVFQAKLPAAKVDFEYYVSAETTRGQTLVWPATAPTMNQTVVVTE